MKIVFKAGDIKVFRRTVAAQDVAAFGGVPVHEVCATFALARDIEWTTRQFVLEMKDEDEEGVGTFLEIHHRSPAFVGEEITFEGRFESLQGHEVRCSVEARVGGRVVAVGHTGQKILKQDKIKSIFGHG